jgi:dTDP-glucose 4,6-dehydratase
VRDYLYVEDHCRALDLVLHEGRVGEVYNVGTGVETSGLQVAEAVLDLMDKPRSLIQFVEDRKGHDYRYALDVTRIRDELGWEPRTTLAEGLELTVRWYQDHQDWWRPLKSGDYWEYYRRNYRQLETGTR